MLLNSKVAVKIASAVVMLSVVSTSLSVFSQDIVASDDITGGSSVFVFRESRKRPQQRSGGRVFRLRAGKTADGANSDSARLAAYRKRRGSQLKGNAAGVARNRARQRNPKLAQAAVLEAKADALLDSEAYDQAIASYRDALRQDPQNTDAARGLSEALTAKNVATNLDPTSREAADQLEEALRLDPKNDIAAERLGDAYAASGNSEKAVAAWERSVQLNPTAGDVYISLGSAYLTLGEIAKAESASGNAERLGVSGADAQNLRGMILFRQNKNTEAMAAFDNVLKSDGRNATAKYYQAMIYDRLKQPALSLAALRKTVADAPDYSQAWFDLGVEYYNAGSYTDAANAYQQAIKYDPANAQAHANLASTYRQLDRYSEANAEYGAAESAGLKTNPDLYSEWGYSLGKASDWDASVAKLETAQQISPTAIDDNNVGWAYYNSAQADKTAKRGAAADEKLRKAKSSLEISTQKDAKLGAAFLNLGSTNNALGDFAAAIAALNVAVGLRNDWVIAINQLGVSFRGQNNLVAAIQQFKRATTLDAGNVFGLFNLGEAYSASGNKKEAKKVQDRLRKIDPSLAGRLDEIISGKIIIDETKRKIQQKIPRLPKLPF